MTPWEIQADEFVTCNCNYGCPCQFNAPPTYGDCQAVAGFKIKKGHFGDVSLDGPVCSRRYALAGRDPRRQR